MISEFSQNQQDGVSIMGIGSFGVRQARVWQENGLRVLYCLDLDNKKSALAKEFKAEFIPMDFRVMGPSETDILRTITNKSRIFNVTAYSYARHELLRFLIESGAQKILVEKPSTHDPRVSGELAKLASSKRVLIQVNYIERAHPVTLAVLADMKRSGFTPREHYHFRTRNLFDTKFLGLDGGVTDPSFIIGSRHLYNEGVHAVSHVDQFRRELLATPISSDPGEIEDFDIQSWKKYDQRRFVGVGADLTTSFRVRFRDGSTVYIHGSYRENPKRCFVITDGDSTAYFGNTLCRGYLTPLAAKVRGKDNVKKLIDFYRSGGWNHSDESLRQLVMLVGGTKLDLSQYVIGNVYETPMRRMIENLHNARSPEELICPLETGVSIESLAWRAYQKSDNPDVLTPGKYE